MNGGQCASAKSFEMPQRVSIEVDEAQSNEINGAIIQHAADLRPRKESTNTAKHKTYEDEDEDKTAEGEDVEDEEVENEEEAMNGNEGEGENEATEEEEVVEKYARVTNTETAQLYTVYEQPSYCVIHAVDLRRRKESTNTAKHKKYEDEDEDKTVEVEDVEDEEVENEEEAMNGNEGERKNEATEEEEDGEKYARVTNTETAQLYTLYEQPSYCVIENSSEKLPTLAELIPHPALNWPFELDTFQKQA
ncbi:unnamed protein product, partial [Mesocestoides corti]|uniref:ELM2 domain-containing protein n=1 Tax=Mesocestoides corti TaxID=53468 RepID=A0A0R3URN8_MESCO